MSALDTIVKVAISLISKAVAQESFSIPLIIGPTPTTWSDKVHAYTDPASMLTDGFTTSSPEYKYAKELFMQPITPTQFWVGLRLSAIKQIDTITPIAVNDHLYKVTVGAVDYEFTADADATVSEIVAGLIALINADSGAPCVASGTVTLILTAKVKGIGFQTSVNADTNMTLVHSIVSHGIADDFAAIMTQENSWYGVVLCSNDADDILQLAAEIEANKKIFVAASDEAAIATSATTDLLSVLKGKSYNRTALIFSPTSYNKGIDAGWVGGQLPQTPGSNTWAFKNLAGISSDKLTDNQRSIVIGTPVEGVAGKNGNVYTTVGGQDVMQMGMMVSGQFIDITIGADWLESQIQTNIYQQLVSLQKIPYTNKGTAALISQVDAAIKLGVVNGLIDGKRDITITAPNVEDVPLTQRANRIAPTITFSCYLSGAFHSTKINGTVSV